MIDMDTQTNEMILENISITFKDLKDAFIKAKVNDESRQVAIVVLRNIFSERQQSTKVSENHDSKALNIADVSNWVAVKDALPDDDNQVFVKYTNGRYGINEWWENDNCWKYNFDKLVIEKWCKPPCC